MAHVDLAKAEAGAIAGEVGRLAALGALAIALVIFAVFLAVVGTALFTAEWLLGSIGWGVLHGFLLFLALAMAAVLLAIGVSTSRIFRALLAAVTIGLVVAFVTALNLPNQLYTRIAEAGGIVIEPGAGPLVVGLVVGALVGLVAAVIAAVVVNLSGGGRLGIFTGLVVLGLAIGAITAISLPPQVGVGIGITVGYVTWMALMAIDVARMGIDVDDLKQRFYPAQTIDTSKETLEWLQKRMPPGIGS